MLHIEEAMGTCYKGERDDEERIFHMGEVAKTQ